MIQVTHLKNNITQVNEVFLQVANRLRLEHGVFTKIKHDKEKKQLIYDDALLKIYDI